MNKSDWNEFKKSSKLKNTILECFKGINKTSEVKIIPDPYIINGTLTICFEINNKDAYLKGKISFRVDKR